MSRPTLAVPAGGVQTRRIVTIQLANDVFGFDVTQVERVLAYRPPAAVPDGPPWVLGVLNQGDRLIPVVDLRRRLSASPEAPGPRTRYVVLRTTTGPIAVQVDHVIDVARVPAGEIQPPPYLYRGIDGSFLRGIAVRHGTVIVVLDAERVLTSTDRIALEHSVAKVPA